MITEEKQEEQLARLAALHPRVRIFQVAREFDWWAWLCESCREIWVGRGWQVRVAKEPPHPLTCDECGRVDAEQSISEAA